MPRKRPRAALSSRSFLSYLRYLDRQAGLESDWTTYTSLIPPEAVEYLNWTTELRGALSRGAAHRAELVGLLRKYETALAVLARDFWETHATQPSA